MKPLLSLLPLLTCALLAACAPRLNRGTAVNAPSTLNCAGERSGTLTRVPFKLSVNVDPQTNEVAGLLTEGGDRSFWVYGRRVADGADSNLILSVSDHTESYAGVDLIVKKARLGYFTASQSTLSGVLSGGQFAGRQKAGVNNYAVTMACQSS